MSKDQKYINELLKQYRDGSISVKDRHELERIALDDPFLFDSMEGYALHKDDKFSNALDRIKSKTSEHAGRIVNMRFVPIAAGLAILIGGLFWINNQFDQTNLEAVSQAVEKEAPQEDKMESESPEVSDSAEFIGIKAGDLAGNAASKELLSANDDPINQIKIVTSKSENADVKMESRSGIIINNDDRGISDQASNTELAQVEAERSKSTAPQKETSIPSASPSISEPTVAASSPAKASDARRTEMERQSRAKKKIEPTIIDNQVLESVEMDNDRFGYSNTSRTLPSKINKRIIRGLVRDNTGEPLIGVTVFDPKTESGVSTDVDGTFQFSIDSSSKELQIAYVGYADLVVSLDSSSTYDLILEDDDQVLDEVVVTGYASNVNDPQPSFVLPPGGRSAYKDIIQKMAESGCDQTGKVKLKFTVTKYGEVTDFEVKKGLSEECNQRAIDIIKTSGRWDNQYNKDKTVRYTISF